MQARWSSLTASLSELSERVDWRDKSTAAVIVSGGAAVAVLALSWLRRQRTTASRQNDAKTRSTKAELTPTQQKQQKEQQKQQQQPQSPVPAQSNVYHLDVKSLLTIAHPEPQRNLAMYANDVCSVDELYAAQRIMTQICASLQSLSSTPVTARDVLGLYQTSMTLASNQYLYHAYRTYSQLEYAVVYDTVFSNLAVLTRAAEELAALSYASTDEFRRVLFVLMSVAAQCAQRSEVSCLAFILSGELADSPAGTVSMMSSLKNEPRQIIMRARAALVPLIVDKTSSVSSSSSSSSSVLSYRTDSGMVYTTQYTVTGSSDFRIVLLKLLQPQQQQLFSDSVARRRILLMLGVRATNIID